MDVEALKKMLEEQTPQIVAEVRSKVIERVAQDFEGRIAALSLKEVDAWFAENVAPAIVAALNDDKHIILEAVRTSVADIAAILAKRMTEHAAEKMEQTYNFRKVAEALFGY